MNKINICDIIDEVINSLDPVFQAFKVGPPEFSCHEDSVVSIDKNGFEKVLRSLFTNAIKYGQGKPVSVQVQVSDSLVEIIVADNGVGIAPEDTQRIFTKFERAISSNEVCGLGLGLYVAREIVEAHGGHIWVISKPGEGSAFHFSIPRLNVESSDRKDSKIVVAQKDLDNSNHTHH